MALVRDDDFESKPANIRTGSRVNSRVRVAIESVERGVRVEGQTMDISSRGCLAVMGESFGIGETLKLTNLMNNKTCPAVLVWTGHKTSAGWELGLQLMQASADFWEIDF